LPLQRLPLFAYQPCVLDRDHCLIGERLDKFDLPIGKRLDPPARKNDGPDSQEAAAIRPYHRICNTGQ